MKPFPTVSLLLLSAFHVLRSAAWIIDQSCNDSQLPIIIFSLVILLISLPDTAPASVVQDALQSAFSQANAGLTAFNQNPQDPSYASLQNLLFPDQPGWPRVLRMSITSL